MDEKLKTLLLEYLGELMYDHQNTFDWIGKDSISEKIKAVNVLLETEYEPVTFLSQVKDIFKSNQ